MCKQSGGTRTLKTGSRNYNGRRKKVAEMLSSGLYSSVTFSEEGGGYVAIQKSKTKHKPEEIEAAHLLAKKGYEVVLKDEAGSKSTIEGYLFSISYEQRTPIHDGANTIRNALFHARDKKADIAVIYSKDHTFTRKSVDEGLKLFEGASVHRFKEIIVIADNGNIHRRKHNK